MHPGEHWVIMGPNGCGKTTLVSTITAYHDIGPTSGGYALFGHEYRSCHWHAVRDSVGLVSQAIAQRIEPDMTAVEIVCTGREDRIAELEPTHLHRTPTGATRA